MIVQRNILIISAKELSALTCKFLTKLSVLMEAELSIFENVHKKPEIIGVLR
jgi:hypothetical protein